MTPVIPDYNPYHHCFGTLSYSFPTLHHTLHTSLLRHSTLRDTPSGVSRLSTEYTHVNSLPFTLQNPSLRYTSHGASLRDTEYALRVLPSLQLSSTRCTSHDASPYNTEYTTCVLPSFYDPHHYSACRAARRCITQNTLHAYSLHTTRRITSTASISRLYFTAQSTKYTIKRNTSQPHFASQLRNEFHKYNYTIHKPTN